MAVYRDKKRNSYFAQFRVNGHRVTKRGFATRAEAQAFEYKAKFEENDVTRIKFQDLVKEYRELYKSKVQYGTFARTGIFFEHYIFPHFPNKYINEITEMDCLKFWYYLRDLEKSSRYRNDILGTFKSVFKHARTFHKLRYNPSEALERFPKSREEKLKKKKRDMNIWTDAEFQQFISCVDNEVYKALFLTLFYTGMRKGEILALTWEDLLDHKINVDKALTRKTDLENSYEIKEPKNVYSIREISLTDSLYEYLLDFKASQALQPGFSEEWFMFGGPVPVAENTLTRAKDTACLKAGVKRIHIHDFRHSHASNLIANGVNIVAVSKRLGHSDIAMTLSIYTHLLEKNDDELITSLENASKNVVKMSSQK